MSLLQTSRLEFIRNTAALALAAIYINVYYLKLYVIGGSLFGTSVLFRYDQGVVLPREHKTYPLKISQGLKIAYEPGFHITF